ncbi:hypothetical protein KY284_019373 [Solanum tuberosum]|nr:hypothetical protein KY284_019373 [Solanum tuberosum]
MLAHVGLLTRKISILVSSENNIDEADFSGPDLLQEIERMKGDIRQNFLKAPELSQHGFPMDDVALIKNETGMAKESLEFLRSSFGRVRQTLDDRGVVKDCWAEHVINSILVGDNSLSHLIFSLPRVTDKIKLIVADVTSLQLKDNNGDDALDTKSSIEPIESTSSSSVKVTLGHKEEEARIIDQLLDEHESELDVISIIGMPGVGKTTLANKIYNNTLVASHFKICAWCTVSQKYNKSKVLREILQQVTCSEEKGSEDDLAEKLRRALLDKRYLNVFDDVRDIATAEMVFGDQGSCPAELSDIGHQIVEKCKGLPLAIVLIAGVIVRGREKEKEKDLWLKIHHNLDSFISANINLQTMKVMQLSYDHLPYHLKSLLLYFARSQKRKRTPVSTLMQLWVAEGLVDHDIPSKCSLEEVTQSYFDALISSSLIMVDHIPTGSIWMSEKIKVCYMHDVVHNFCSVKAEKEKFLKLINSGDPFHASDFLHRRLTIHTDDSQLHKKCVLLNSDKCSSGSKHLISLTVSGYLDDSRLLKLSKLKHVSIDQSSFFEEDADPCRILEGYHNAWDYYGYPIEYHFPTILKELRLYALPVRAALLSAIATLPQLEILAIMDSYFVDNKWDASEDIYQSLKTLSLSFAKYSEWEVDRETFPNLEELILECCHKLREIPSGFGDIETLKSIRVVKSKRELGDSVIEIKKQLVVSQERTDFMSIYHLRILPQVTKKR